MPGSGNFNMFIWGLLFTMISNTYRNRDPKENYLKRQIKMFTIHMYIVTKYGVHKIFERKLFSKVI